MTPLFRSFGRLAGCALLLLGAAAPMHAQGAPRSADRSRSFVTGADLSYLPRFEAEGVKYHDGGKEASVLEIARSNGWRVIRVRLWVDPDATPAASVSRLSAVSALGRRIKAAGLEFMLDIHYSDTWADPGHQKKPAAWADLPFPRLVQEVHDYSRDAVAHLRREGAMPDYVQVGNETKNGLLYGSGVNGSGPQPGGGFWEPDKQGTGRAARLLAAGLSGVREGAAGRPLVTILHIPDGQDTGFVKWYFQTLGNAARAARPPVKLPYDMVGLSYYPGIPWDPKAGYAAWRLSHLTASLDYVAETLHKPVMVVETSWPQAGAHPEIAGTPEFPLTPDGQVQFYRALIHAVKSVPDGLGRGVIVWETDALNWDSVFDAHGSALPAVRVLGQP